MTNHLKPIVYVYITKCRCIEMRKNQYHTNRKSNLKINHILPKYKMFCYVPKDGNQKPH